jgi:hypothetical protein
LVAVAVNGLMNQPQTDAAWEALLEALNECGILLRINHEIPNQS